MANVVAGHRNLVPCRGRANVIERIWVADDRQGTAAAIRFVPGTIDNSHRAVSLAGQKIQQSRRRRPKRRAVGVVAHRKMLRVVPESCDGVPIEVTHRQTLSSYREWRRVRWRSGSSHLAG